ncbi:MAG: hypothetical protein JOZ38_00905, partial [Candidatus Eremiobacteraeota bacterium]|nr:hypothetical protein [Candidatus Eremiobacteraeota bacterium]
PRYGHLPLILNEDHSKLSKRHSTVGIEEYRKQGFLPEALLDHLVLLGWSPGDDREEFTLEELTQRFSLERVHKAPAVYNMARLRAFNQRALKKLPRETMRRMLAAAMQERGLLETPPPEAALRWIDTFIEAYGEELHCISDAIPIVESLRAEAVPIPALELERLRSRDVLFYIDAVAQYVDAQPELLGLPLGHDLVEIAKEFGLSKKDAFACVRMALTGQTKGAPLHLLFPLLGHDRIMIRIGAVNSKLLHGRGLEPIKFGPDGRPFEPIRGNRPAGELSLGPAETRIRAALGRSDRSELVQLVGDDTRNLEAAEAIGVAGVETAQGAELLADVLSTISPQRYVVTPEGAGGRYLVVKQ